MLKQPAELSRAYSHSLFGRALDDRSGMHREATSCRLPLTLAESKYIIRSLLCKEMIRYGSYTFYKFKASAISFERIPWNTKISNNPRCPSLFLKNSTMSSVTVLETFES